MSLCFEPHICLIVLALGTVPVFARMIAVVELLTGVTQVDLAAKGFGSALFYGRHGLEVARKHATGELFPVVGSMNTEDIGYFHHLKDPP
jgi:AMMECR1 domain-containing protein